MINVELRGAWSDLDAKLRPFVARRVRSASDVDDVVQDVFLRMQRGLGSLRDDQRFGPWVYQVARSAIIDHQRSVTRRVGSVSASSERELDGLLGANEDVANEDAGSVERELATYIAPFIAMLAAPYREALTLTELEGMTQKDAAQMLGISVSGMKSRVQRGRLLLRKALEDCCHIALDARGHVMACAPRADAVIPEGCCAMSSCDSSDERSEQRAQRDLVRHQVPQD